MPHQRLTLYLVCAFVIGCSTRVANPLTADTRGASVSDGYQAALATVESGHYTVVVDDKANAFLRIGAQSSKACGGCTFDIKAWQGSVDVYLKAPPNQALNDTETKRLHEEGMNLAWAIAQRARTLAGPAERTTPPDHYRDFPTVPAH